MIERDNHVRPVRANIGMSDGAVTEIEGTGLKDGVCLIIGEELVKAKGRSSSGRSPFKPQIGRGQQQSQRGQAPSGAR